MKKINKGTFKKTPKGKKTPKMLAVEKGLGRTLEEDYMEFHINGDFGQKKLAERWGVARTSIFKFEEGRRPWIEMLGLPSRTARNPSLEIKTRNCEICSEPPPLDKAHWIDKKFKGSTRFYNIINLCPNCHRKLDRGNENIYIKAQTTLFYRSMKKLLEKHKHTEDEKRELLIIGKQIINKKL